MTDDHIARKREKMNSPVSYCPETSKVSFDKKGAVTARNLRYKQAHTKLRIYECQFCGRWHLTSQAFRRK